MQLILKINRDEVFAPACPGLMHVVNRTYTIQGTITGVRLTDIVEGISAATTSIFAANPNQGEVNIVFRSMITGHTLNYRVEIFGGSIMTKASLALMSVVLILLHFLK